MKLLFDQNLSWKWVSRLADIFPDASHVQFHGLADKTDTPCELLLRNITNLHSYIPKRRPLYFMTDKGFRVLSYIYTAGSSGIH